MAADARALEGGHAKEPLDTFLTIFMGLRFGVKNIAARHIQGLVEGVANHQTVDERCKMFGRFVGLLEHQVKQEKEKELKVVAGLWGSPKVSSGGESTAVAVAGGDGAGGGKNRHIAFEPYGLEFYLMSLGCLCKVGDINNAQSIYNSRVKTKMINFTEKASRPDEYSGGGDEPQRSGAWVPSNQAVVALLELFGLGKTIRCLTARSMITGLNGRVLDETGMELDTLLDAIMDIWNCIHDFEINDHKQQFHEAFHTGITDGESQPGAGGADGGTGDGGDGSNEGGLESGMEDGGEDGDHCGRVLRSVPMLQHLDDDEMRLLIRSLEREQFEPGASVIRQGEVGSTFYIIRQGEVDVLKSMDGGEPVFCVTLGHGKYFGEQALLNDEPRNSTIRAKGPVECFVLSREKFEVMDHNLGLRVLKAIPMLQHLHDDEMRVLIQSLERERFEAGWDIIRQGEAGGTFYIIREGEVDVLKSTDGGDPVSLAELGHGQYFGEQALLNDAPRNSSIRAKGPVECFVLSREKFEVILGPLQVIMEREADVRHEETAERHEEKLDKEETDKEAAVVKVSAEDAHALLGRLLPGDHRDNERKDVHAAIVAECDGDDGIHADGFARGVFIQTWNPLGRTTIASSQLIAKHKSRGGHRGGAARKGRASMRKIMSAGGGMAAAAARAAASEEAGGGEGSGE